MQTIPTKSVALGRNLGHATARSPAEFEIEARNAAERPSKQGGDQIKVKFSAPANTTVANILELPEGRYKVEYTAPIAGTYQLTVTMNGEHIMGSPFKLLVTLPRAQAELCTLSGKALTRLTAGEVGSFTIGFIDKMGNQAPPEELDIRVKPAGAPDLPRDENGDLVVPDRVQKTFNSFDADGSGDIDFSELRQALSQLGMDGDRKAAAVLLRRYDSDGGGLSIQEFTQLVADMQMAQSTGYLLRGVVPTQEKGFREVRIEVKVAGDYEMSIAFSAAAGAGVLRGSPYTVTVYPGRASPETTELPTELANGLKTAVGESGFFVLQAKDQFKNLSIRGGDRIRVSAAGALSAGCDDLGNGTYKITYQCDEAGVHKLEVKVGDAHVKGSPLAVTCEPGPIHVPSCELLHSGAAESVVAGRAYALMIRARDRFGNETANVHGSGVGFAVELRRPSVWGEVGAGMVEPAGRGLVVPTTDPGDRLIHEPAGQLEMCEGRWVDGGMYELTYIPASRGQFHLHVVCVKETEDGSEPTRMEVASFFPMPIDVAPLGPDASMSLLVNAERWHHEILGAGTRLLMLVHLRDRFGNACSWPYDESSPDEHTRYTAVDGQSPYSRSVDKRQLYELKATMHMAGAGLSTSESRPNEHRLAPRDESIGQYEARHTLSRAGRFRVVITLGGKPIGGSPLLFQVTAARAAGLKSRLLLPAPKSEPSEKEKTVVGNDRDSPAEGEAFSPASSTSPPPGKMSGGPGSGRPSSGIGRSPNRKGEQQIDHEDGGNGCEPADHGTPAVASASMATPLVGQLYRCLLRARDAFGNTVYSGGSKVEVQVQEPPVEPGSEADHILAPKLECSVHDILNGVYHIDLIVAQPGLHTMMVRLDGVEVLGSPLSIMAIKPRVLASMKAAGKSRGETLYAVGAAIANAGINWAFKSWAEWAYDNREALDTLSSVAAALRNRHIYASWSCWREQTTAYKHARHKMSKALAAVHKQITRRGLNSWLDFVACRRRNTELLYRVVGALKSLQLLIGFNTWVANAGLERITIATEEAGGSAYGLAAA